MIIAGLEIITEIMIIAVPAALISRVQMQAMDKRRALLLFAFRTG